MIKTAFTLLLALHGQHGVSAFLQDGMEFVYEETGVQTAGTMNYDPSAAGISWKSQVRMQVAGNQIHVKVTDIKGSQFVGQYPVDHSIWKTLEYTSYPGGYEFSINYENGKIHSVDLPVSLNKAQRNTIKAAAANLQINLEAMEKPFLKSQEKLLHGDCQVTYTVSEDGLVIRSLSHSADCANRPMRIIDNWRGWRCDHQYSSEARLIQGEHFIPGRNSPEPLYSKSDSFYLVEKATNNRYLVKHMRTEGAVIAQSFEAEGVSHFIYTNRELTLKDMKPSDGSIQPSNTVRVDNVAYEFDDEEYKWNKDRDLKAREPIFTAGLFYDIDQNSLETAALNALEEMHKNFDLHDNSKETVDRLHKYGMNSLMPTLMNMDYNSLNSVFNKLRADNSNAGTVKRKFFTEFIGTVGTTAAAMVIKDAINHGMFDSGDEAAKALSAIPFQIKRPNIQLVKEIESLMVTNTDKTVAMSLQLTLAHLVRMTCERAGKMMSWDNKKCLEELSDVYAKQFYDNFLNGNNEERVIAIHALGNLRWGSVSEVLRPLVYGQVKDVDDNLQAKAIHAAVFGTLMTDTTADYLLPVFANRRNGYETRIAALHHLAWGSVKTSTLSTVFSILFYENNHEMINYAYTHFEKIATSIDPCVGEKKDLFAYFLKYMKQTKMHRGSYAFGVSKTYDYEFNSDKYGYGGKTEFTVIGSDRSFTPISFGFDTFINMHESYQSHVLGMHFRVEGVAKSLIETLLKYPEGQWKLQDLANLLASSGYKLRTKQPLRVEVTIQMRGVTVISNVYDESFEGEGKKVTDLIKDLQGGSAAKEYSISKQKGFMLGYSWYEQPTEAGSPMTFGSSLTVFGSLEATVKRGFNRGALTREISADVHLTGQFSNFMAFQVLATKKIYSITQDRVYAYHIPREMEIAVNIPKKELKIKGKQPDIKNPVMFLMHSQTFVKVSGLVQAVSDDITANCPSCPGSWVISKGKDHAKTRVISEYDDAEMGTLYKSEYFDCETDIDDEKRIVAAMTYLFAPVNADKNPNNLSGLLFLGFAKMSSFFLWFPKAEKCGYYQISAQSPTNPVKEIIATLQGKIKDNGEKYMSTGKDIMVKVTVTLKGEPEERNYKIQFQYDFTPLAIENTLRFQFVRAASPALDISDYTLCLSANNKYSDPAPELFYGKFDDHLQQTGEVLVKYGSTTNCGSADGEVRIEFQHETTGAAQQDLQKADYYKKCKEDMAKPEWRQRSLPVTGPCYLTMYDSGLARRYHWDMQFSKMSPTLMDFISRGLTISNTFLAPYMSTNVDKIMNLLRSELKMQWTVEYKDRDSMFDWSVVTSQGTNNYTNIPVPNPSDLRMQTLRSLRTSRVGMDLVASNLLNYCIQSSGSLRTLDQSEMTYTPDTCWSLLSGDCAENPTYAVFTKRGSSLPLDMKVYAGGNEVLFVPQSSSNMQITVNGNGFQVADGDTKNYKIDDNEIFSISRWGNTYTISSFPSFTVMFDGVFAEVMPGFNVYGQHCGMCGNMDGRKDNDLVNKAGEPIGAEEMAQSWCK